MENENQQQEEKKSNLDYLKDALKYLGFGDKMHQVLESAIKGESPEFTLGFSALYDRPDSNKKDNLTRDYVSYDLNFKKSADTDNYFFNSYTATMTTKAGEERSQKFYVDKGRGITAKEAYNLFSGRAVYKTFVKKDNEKYNAFMQYDLKSPKDEKGNYAIQKFHENYGYKVDTALAAYPLKYETPDQKAELIKSLEKGNAHPVKLENGQKLFAVAAPQYKDIKFFDNHNKQVQVGKINQGEKEVASKNNKMKM